MSTEHPNNPRQADSVQRCRVMLHASLSNPESINLHARARAQVCNLVSVRGCLCHCAVSFRS